MTACTRALTSCANAASIASGRVALTSTISSPSLRAAASVCSLSCLQASRIASSMTMPTRFRPGTTSASSERRLVVSASFIDVTPVTRVPGRGSDFTNSSSTGSRIVATMIGVEREADHAAAAIGVAGAKKRSTRSSASSRASDLNRRGSFDAERSSSTRFLPST